MGAVMTRAGYAAYAKACHKAIDSAINLDEFYEGIGALLRDVSARC